MRKVLVFSGKGLELGRFGVRFVFVVRSLCVLGEFFTLEEF